MKLTSRHYAVLAFALLIACVLGCKSSGSSTSSTTAKTDAPKNANNTTATTTNPPAPIPDIAGEYNVAGSNPNGATYKGTLEILTRGDVYQFRWDAGTQYDGVGVANANVVAVAFASGANGKGCGVVDYNIQDDGALDGKWGYWGVSQAGTEKATRTSGSGLEVSQHVECITAEKLKPAIEAVIAEDAHMMTDTSTVLRNLGKGRRHSLVNHKASEYVRYDEGIRVTTNTVEGYFSLLKRGVYGVYHHVGRKHLHRYLSEFDFRYNGREITDGERALAALKGFEGKRLTYKGPDGQI